MLAPAGQLNGGGAGLLEHSEKSGARWHLYHLQDKGTALCTADDGGGGGCRVSTASNDAQTADHPLPQAPLFWLREPAASGMER